MGQESSHSYMDTNFARVPRFGTQDRQCLSRKRKAIPQPMLPVLCVLMLYEVAVSVRIPRLRYLRASAAHPLSTSSTIPSSIGSTILPRPSFDRLLLTETQFQLRISDHEPSVVSRVMVAVIAALNTVTRPIRQPRDLFRKDETSDQ